MAEQSIEQPKSQKKIKPANTPVKSQVKVEPTTKQPKLLVKVERKDATTDANVRSPKTKKDDDEFLLHLNECEEEFKGGCEENCDDLPTDAGLKGEDQTGNNNGEREV